MRSTQKIVIILIHFLFFSSLCRASMPIDTLLSVTRSALTLTSIPIFSIGTTDGSSDSITSVLITACNFQAANFNDCYNADNNGSLATTGSLSITTGDTLLISIPALANPLNFWQNFYPYNTPYTAVRITNSQGTNCDSTVVAYECTSSTTCPSLSFTPVVLCNFS